MARAHPTPIPPFPPHIDRDFFGAYLTGLVDGEGCFDLGIVNAKTRPTPKCRFAISLRSDDRAVLELAQSFWGCGKLYWRSRATGQTENANPQLSFIVDAVSDLFGVLLPHFNRFTPMAKKKHDFALWEKAVILCQRLSARKIRGANRVGHHRGGFRPKWTEEELAEYTDLRSALKAVRVFNAPPPVLPFLKPVPPSHPSLFDGLP